MSIEFLLAKIITDINTYIIPLLIAGTIVMLFYGIFQYVKSGGDAAKSNGIKTMTAGIMGLVVMLSVWGIVAMVTNTLGINGSTTITLPHIGT